jgi:hypothetical protein
MPKWSNTASTAQLARPPATVWVVGVEAP